MRYVITLFVGFLACSCNSKVEKTTETKGHSNDKSNDITLAQESTPSIQYQQTKTGHSYYVYKPNKNTDKQYSVYFIDSQGRGNMPIEKYKILADSFGLTLVGINSIRNNMDTSLVREVWNDIHTETQSKFDLYPTTHLVGFSGGARYCTIIADHDSTILAVTGCAAGFGKQIQSSKDVRFHYLGLVGIHDFNYIEMMKLNQVLEPFPVKHFIMTWDGKHEWPKNEIMYLSFTWYTNILNKNGLLKLDSGLIAERYNSIAPEIKKIPKSHEELQDIDLLSELEKSEMMSFIFTDSYDCSEYTNQRRAIYWPSEFKQQLAKHKSNLAMEAKRQLEFANYLFEKDTSWWNTQVEFLNNDLETYGWTKDMKVRILQYCSLQLYFICNGELKAGDLNNFQKHAYLYRLIDPGNTEAHFYKAISLAQQNQKKGCFDELQLAQKAGLDSKDKILMQPDFRKYSNESEFINLIKMLN